MRNYYVISRWVVSCLKGFEREGWNTKKILSNANVEEQELSNFYVPLSAVERIFNAAYEEAGAGAGLMTRHGLVPGTFHYLSLAAVSSKSVKDALVLMSGYNDYLTNAIQYFCREDESSVTFGFKVPSNINLSPQICEAILATTVRTSRFICTQDNLIQRVCLAHTVDNAQQRFQDYAHASVEIADEYSVRFNSEPANARSIHYDEVLLRKNEQLLIEDLAQGNNVNFRSILVSYLAVRLGKEELTIERVAQGMNMSVRTLQRRLKDESTNFKAVQDSVRRTKAAQLMVRTQYSICYIAQELGFSDSANFCRAFKRWYQCPPERYRKELKQSSAPIPSLGAIPDVII